MIYLACIFNWRQCFMTQQEVIKAFNQSLNQTELSGRAALDEAVKASSNFSSYQEVVDKFLKDQKSAKN